MIRQSKRKFATILLLLLIASQTHATSDSPEAEEYDCWPCKPCSRDNDSGRLVAHCSAEKLVDVPWMDDNIQELRLDGNRLELVKDDAFANQKMVNLEVLDLSNNLISSVEAYAFHNLTNIIDINLGNNKITELHPNTFRTTAKLHTLKLNNNNITKIEDGLFNNLTELVLLRLDNNRISYIGSKAFVGLPKLKNLHLEYNKLQQIEPSIFEDLDVINMERLRLSSNPWNCDCHLRNLVAWLEALDMSLKYNNNAYCVQPASHSGQNLLYIDIGSLACTPEILTVGYTENADSRSMSLTCVARGVPNPEIHWMFGGRILFNNTQLLLNGESKYTNSELSDTDLQLIVTVHNITNRDFGEYTCSVKNSAGQVEADLAFGAGLVEADLAFGHSYSYCNSNQCSPLIIFIFFIFISMSIPTKMFPYV